MRVAGVPNVTGRVVTVNHVIGPRMPLAPPPPPPPPPYPGPPPPYPGPIQVSVNLYTIDTSWKFLENFCIALIFNILTLRELK